MTAVTGRTVVLVSCVSRKQPGPCKAKDLYCSSFFRKARAYAERVGDAWYILSAEHGLLCPDTVIVDYDRTLNRMPIAERLAWADRVSRDLSRVIKPSDRVQVLAGSRYREFVMPALRTLCAEVSVPMEGLTIGKQLQWLDTQGKP
ncbi:MAG: hypothetical protein KBC96_12120 [Armatimonadetes bacterium]|nr:hypothetical protein [Armatimonadota bacterium]